MKFKKYINLPTKLTLAIMLVFIAMLTVFSVIFYSTGSVMENEAIKHIEYNAEAISRSLDEVVLNIYNVSDTFALDDRLSEYTERDYSSDLTRKRFATTQISNVLFASYDLLRNNEKMAAFINNHTGEVFNFLNPNADDEKCRQALDAMEVNSSDKLAKFCWYPVTYNFLKQDTTGDIRKDNAIIGSRRVFSRLHNSYIGVHIFALSEETLYKKYSEIASQYDSTIYIMNESGALLSSSSENVLANGYVPEDLRNPVLNREYDRFEYGSKLVFVQSSAVNDWLTVICVPQSSLTDVVTKLHRWIFAVLISCGLIALFLTMFFYKKFMRPVSVLSTAMRRVNDGDLSAYVTETPPNNELGQMLAYYNSMLGSINKNINERLRAEKHKKQLELDILMNQINPHFLYNTLETIVWKSTEAGCPDIGRIAASLGRMYRLSISGGNLFVSIHQELEHVGAYMKIQQSRYEDGFTFETKAGYAQLRDFYTIKMLLQPIAENALAHGIDGLDRVLHIRLTVKVLKDHILVRITDTGAGMDRDKLKRVRHQLQTGERAASDTPPKRKKSTGIGMHNVYERLRIYFGGDADISIWSRKNTGTCVSLILPIISPDEAKKLNEEKNN